MYLYTEANTCLYTLKRLFKETNVFTREGKRICLIYTLQSDLYYIRGMKTSMYL